MSEKSLIDRLKMEIVDSLSQILKGKKCILMIYPGYLNGGDGLIWLGELRLFEDLGVRVVSSFPDTRIDKHFIDSLDYELILIQGGGNFGDIWPGLNECRRKVIDNYRHKKIVQLPVTIEFRDKQKLLEMQSAISKHPSFVLTVRDEISYKFAKEHFNCDTHLVPDTAFYNDMSVFTDIISSQRCRDILYFMRTDKESNVKVEDIEKDTKDWLDYLTPAMILKNYIFCRILFRDYFRFLPEVLNKTRTIMKFKKYMYRIMENYHRKKFIVEINNVIREMNKYRLVVTDRLHIHMLSVLCDVPSILVSGIYHKNEAYYNTWMTGNLTSDICKNSSDLDLKIADMKNRAAIYVN
jgi:pyruvyl transferase EpsO